MKDSLCDTGISATALRGMYPGPYSDIWMAPSSDGGINGLADERGALHGYCDVSITQKEGKVLTVARVYVRVKPKGTADQLHEFYKRSYPDHQRHNLTLGPAKGFTTPDKSVLVFDCRNPKKRTSKDGVLGVSAQVLLPEHRPTLDVDRTKVAKGAAELVADTARYVSSVVLKCSGTRLPDGAPAQEPLATQQAPARLPSPSQHPAVVRPYTDQPKNGPGDS